MLREKLDDTGKVPEPLIVLLVIVALSIGTVFGVIRLGGSNGDGGGNGTNTTPPKDFLSFKNDEFGISFAYPPAWSIVQETQNENQIFVLARENITDNGRAKAGLEIRAGDLKLPKIENYKNQVMKTANQSENLNIISGPTDVTLGGSKAIDVTIEYLNQEGEHRTRLIYGEKDEQSYRIMSLMEKNYYDEFENDLEKIFDSFSIS